MATIKSYTDIEQSRKLAEILPLESADMYYDRYGTPSFIDKYVTYKSIKNDKYQHLIPCWSLPALLGVLPSAALVSSNDHYYRLSCMKRFTEWYDNPVDACVAMIEKLHELKLKLIDKVEPKFEVGDWVVSNLDKKARQISEVHFDEYNSYYVVDGNSVNLEEYDRLHHLWTIQDAKDGDVLCCESGWTCIFKTLVNDEIFSSYCFMDNTEWFCETGSECHTLKDEFVKAYNGKPYPAIKEQRNLLFQKMKEAGYEWDAEHKQLKKIEQKPVIEMKTPEESLGIDSETYNKIVDECIYGEQKPTDEVKPRFKVGDTVKDPYGSLYHITEIIDDSYKTDDGRFILFKNEDAYTVFTPAWSEEDETNLEEAVYYIRREPYIERYVEPIVTWLRNLKERVQPQLKQEWSEEDEEMYKEVLTDIIYAKNDLKAKECHGLSKRAMEAFNWFSNRYKSLRPQDTWKPSDEQMKALNDINLTGGISYVGQEQELTTLYNDLKKLKE